jgi:hypothetical protein
LHLDAHPYTLLFLSVLLSSYLYGVWSGVIAIILSCAIQPSYLAMMTAGTGAYKFILNRDSGEFFLSCATVVYLSHKLDVANLTLSEERETLRRQKADAFTAAIDLMSIQLADLLTVIISHSEMALPEGSKELAEIRAAGVRGGRLVAELQLMARSKKNEL